MGCSVLKRQNAETIATMQLSKMAPEFFDWILLDFIFAFTLNLSNGELSPDSQIV